MKRSWLGVLLAVVAVCAAGCVAFSNTAPPLASATPVSGYAPGRGSYTGVHWLATQVWRGGVTYTVPAAISVTVDFLESGSVVFGDGVNVLDARWAPLAGDAVRLREVRSSAAGYAGRDARQLAAIFAVQRLTFSAEAGNPATSDITVTRTGNTLRLTGTGVRIFYQIAGPTAPELAQTVPAATDLSVQSSTAPPAARSPAAGDTATTIRYDLLTHCGIREALIQEHYYLASPAIDDGNGNPPKGWGNPYDSGAMTINPDRTADFLDAAGNWAHFVERPGATTWLHACA